MNVKKAIDSSSGVAVFVRNHAKYLKSAAERNILRPEQPTTFRAVKGWVSAQYALQKHNSLICYMAPIGGDKMVEYQATIHHIKLNPEVGEKETEALLGFSLETTEDERLWEESGRVAKTLYTISHCEKLKKPFPMAELVKVSDGASISENYGYSYSLVHEHHADIPESLLISPEETTYEGMLFYEGEVRKASVKRRQRSAQTRKRCLGHYGYDCEVCGFNFESVYGDIGKEFIHVHHLSSLAKTDVARPIDPIEDLRPVCPNCHSMLHSQAPELSIEELKKRMELTRMSHEIESV